MSITEMMNSETRAMKKRIVADIQFKRQMRVLENNAGALLRDADAKKNEAVALEKQGKHLQAVSAAKQAQVYSNGYELALKQIGDCSAKYAEGKSIAAINECIQVCTGLVKNISVLLDPRKIAKVFARFKKAERELEETSTIMNTVTESIRGTASSVTIDQAGEDALNAFMAEAAAAEPETVQAPVMEPVPVAADPAPVPADPTPAAEVAPPRTEWQNDRRKLLAEMI